MRDWKDVNEVSSRFTGDTMYIQPIAWYTEPSRISVNRVANDRARGV